MPQPPDLLMASHARLLAEIEMSDAYGITLTVETRFTGANGELHCFYGMIDAQDGPAQLLMGPTTPEEIALQIEEFRKEHS